jgi:hypothetical protein
VNPQELATLVLDADQAAKAVRRIFRFQNRMQLSQHRAVRLLLSARVQLRLLIAGQPVTG